MSGAQSIYYIPRNDHDDDYEGIAHDTDYKKYFHLVNKNSGKIQVTNMTHVDQFMFFGQPSEGLRGFNVAKLSTVSLCLCFIVNENLRNGPMPEMMLKFFGLKDEMCPLWTGEERDEQKFIIKPTGKRIGPRTLMNRMKNPLDITTWINMETKSVFGNYYPGYYDFKTCACNPNVKIVSRAEFTTFFEEDYEIGVGHPVYI